MVKLRQSSGSTVSEPAPTLTLKTTRPTSGTQANDDVETQYNINSFRNRTQIFEVHIVPTVSTQFIARIYENDGFGTSDKIYEVETTSNGDEVHDSIQDGLRYVDEDSTSELHMTIENKSAGAASAFDIKIKHVSEV